jgi:uncharacterized protein YggU (UPF0235/DUF167 family)
VRLTIRVQPGSKWAEVGGERDGALVVRTRSRAVDGKATAEALRLVADELGLRRADVRLVSGATSRIKIVELPDQDWDAALATLRAR